MKKWGLALGGGGILGLAHVGVLQVLIEQGLRPDIVTGTSSGSIVAGLYAADVGMAQIEDTTAEALAAEGDPVHAEALRAWSGGIRAKGVLGLVGSEFIEAALDKVTKEAMLKDATVGLSLTSVDVISGSPVVFTNVPPQFSSARTKAINGRQYAVDASIAQAIRASISVPGIFKPMVFGPWALLDGGIRDMVPVYEARRMGADEVVAVDLGHYIDKSQELNGIMSIVTRSFQLATRETTERNIIDYASITLQPDVYETGLPNKEMVQRLIEAGRKCAEEQLGRIKAIVT